MRTRPLGPGLALWGALLLAGALVLADAPAAAQPAVPPLTGRVVDLADLLDAPTEAQLTRRLAALEDSTSHQVAVLTLPSLEGAAIEPVATQIFNAWQLGQTGLNNGVLLLVARDDRRLRIEVGVGLEGVLTDAEAGRIIRGRIVPRFRAGDFAGGIRDGVIAIDKEVRGREAQAGPVAPPGVQAARYQRPTTVLGRVWWFLASDDGWFGVFLLVPALLVLYGLAYWFLVGGFASSTRWVALGAAVLIGTPVVLFLLVFAGQLVTIALYDRPVREGAWLLLAPVAWVGLLLGVDRWMAADPVWQRWRAAMRRVGRLKAKALKDRKKVTIHTWGRTITYDGKRAATSGSGGGSSFSSGGFSSGGFSGGGGFSSGGGASGSW